MLNYEHPDKPDDILNLYTVSELYMVSDRSPDFEETWSFLDRRMSDIGLLISAKTTVSESFPNFGYNLIALSSLKESHLLCMANARSR